MRSLGDLVAVNYNLPDEMLGTDTETLVRRLSDVSWYPPEKRILVALALIARLTAERDALRAEVEVLRQRAEAAEREQRISAHELALIEPHTTRGITDSSTPLHIRVQNIVAQLEAAESRWRTASYVCHDQAERLAKLTGERDALRAEVEALRLRAEAAERERDEMLEAIEIWSMAESRSIERSEEVEAEREALRAEVEVLREALRVIHTTARGDEKGECWTIRKWLDERDMFNDDISGGKRLVEMVCRAVLALTQRQGEEGKE